MEHDQLFKELLTTFFREFIELFFPKLAEHLEPEFRLIPMQQEIFDDIESKERHVVDLLMRGKFKGQDAYFLVHVENQATAQADFPKRMFEYFARLTLKHKLPVYPIVVFSYDAPKRAEPTRHVVTFPDTQVLRFQYRVVQLNRIPWRRFLKSKNPVATALMAKMKIARRDRPKAKAELLRILVSQKLDPARTKLIWVFIERYLQLSAAETRVYDREVSAFAPEERETTMEFKTSWELAGEHKGKNELVARMLRKRFGILTEQMAMRLTGLTSEKLDELGEALIDFTSLDDLEQWLARR